MTSETHDNRERIGRACVVLVNYQTPDLLEAAVGSFRAWYPDLPMTIADNGSEDDSKDVIGRLAAEYRHTDSVLFDDNLGHGPAMHAVIKRGEYDYYLFLDSDTVTNRGGFLEQMLAEYDDDRVYAVGRIVPMNKRGFVAQGGFDALDAAYMLIRESMYRRLPGFKHHGAPVVANFAAAAESGLVVRDFPIQDYIDHLHRGTVSRYGYGLGLRGRWNYLLNKLGI